MSAGRSRAPVSTTAGSAAPSNTARACPLSLGSSDTHLTNPPQGSRTTGAGLLLRTERYSPHQVTLTTVCINISPISEFYPSLCSCILTTIYLSCHCFYSCHGHENTISIGESRPGVPTKAPLPVCYWPQRAQHDCGMVQAASWRKKQTLQPYQPLRADPRDRCWAEEPRRWRRFLYPPLHQNEQWRDLHLFGVSDAFVLQSGYNSANRRWGSVRERIVVLNVRACFNRSLQNHWPSQEIVWYTTLKPQLVIFTLFQHMDISDINLLIYL